MANARLHVICGNCGCNDLFTLRIDPTGSCDREGNEYPSATLTCGNCSTNHTLDEDMLPHPIPENEKC